MQVKEAMTRLTKQNNQETKGDSPHNATTTMLQSHVHFWHLILIKSVAALGCNITEFKEGEYSESTVYLKIKIDNFEYYIKGLLISVLCSKIRAGEPAAIISRELSEQTKNRIHSGDITYTVRALGQLVDLLDVQLRNLTPGGKDSAARSLNKV